MIAPPTIWHSAALGAVPHGFAGRRGGVSSDDLASLNCGTGSGDDPALIAENRRRAADAILPGAALVGVFQVHGANAVTVDRPWQDVDRPHADAIVTDRPGILLGILTADCVPVLFADQAAGVVGAAHAGWKGALAGVTDATINAMVALGAARDQIAAAIGPCIGRASYEVDVPLYRAVVDADPDNDRFFLDGRPGRWQFDLPAYVAARIAAAGVCRVDDLGLDTYALADDFYSYRRSTHGGTSIYGRQISMIGLAP